MNAQHSSLSCEWFTPLDIISRATKVLGGITLDPASSHAANALVGAQSYYTAENDGLSQHWFGNIFLNPPSGKRGGSSLPQLFWDKLQATREESFFEHAIVVCFSIEQLQTTQRKATRAMTTFPMCIPSRRIAFVPGAGQEAGSPSHANSILYVAGRRRNNFKLFAETFNDVGSILVPA